MGPQNALFPKLCSAPPLLVFPLTFSACLLPDLEVGNIRRLFHCCHTNVSEQPCQECWWGIRCVISTSRLSNESGEPDIITIQWASFTLHQEILWALDISTRGIVRISPILEGSNDPPGYRLRVLLDILVASLSRDPSDIEGKHSFSLLSPARAVARTNFLHWFLPDCHG